MNSLIHVIKKNKYLVILLIVGFILRIVGINWDQGGHFHPDERMLIMVADRIHFWNQLNPDFFNYGSLPVYILKGTSQILDIIVPGRIANYDGMLYVGRFLSLICDLIVIVLIYKIARLLFEKKEVGLFATFFYVFAFFPIQNTHFFIVDTFLNVFVTTLVYLLLSYYKNASKLLLIFIGITFAAAITTKVTAILFAPIIGFTLFISLRGTWLHKITNTLFNGLILSVITIIFAFLFMPFGFIHLDQFINEITLQLRMNSDPYIFPYTLQYVGTLPYLYYIKNIAIWGVGPFIFGFFLLGIYEQIIQIQTSHFKKWLKVHHKEIILFIIFNSVYILYFLVIGKSAVKFMRYMLLMYPFITIIAGYGAYELFYNVSPKLRRNSMIITFGFIMLWTLAFINIYSKATTRIEATQWINKYIPAGSILAVEHWDDRVPVFDPGKYQYEEMTLYERPDDEIKWEGLKQKLNRTDYIIIASNRLYIPLQKLHDCDKYLSCYPKTADYYQKLFNEELGFQKVAEFSSYPRIPLGPWTFEIIDDTADESFTVYDHPKIMIFRKMTRSVQTYQ